MINLIWLIVEKAITFLKSISKEATKPPIKKVNPEKNLNKKSKPKKKYKSMNLTKTKIPAVTRVEEWTIAEIGVGATIAKGNQEERGNWALLVIQQKNISKRNLSMSTNPLKNQ